MLDADNFLKILLHPDAEKSFQDILKSVIEFAVIEAVTTFQKSLETKLNEFSATVKVL